MLICIHSFYHVLHVAARLLLKIVKMLVSPLVHYAIHICNTTSRNQTYMRPCELACQGNISNFSLCEINKVEYEVGVPHNDACGWSYWHCRQITVVMPHPPKKNYTDSLLTVADITSCQFKNKNILQCCDKHSNAY